MSREEEGRLDRIAAESRYSAGVMGVAIRHCACIFRRHLLPGATLELGPAEGLMTDALAPLVPRLTVVEGALSFCHSIKRRHPGVEVVHSLFETYQPTEKFRNIILGHVLEHVEDPVAIMERVREWLTPRGRILASVPNARSMHRQAAVIMGLLSFEEDLNEADLCHGHRRVFNPETFRQVFVRSGLQIETFGGYWLKPVSNNQLETSWTPSMLEAFMQLGERYPDIAGEIFITATWIPPVVRGD